MNKHVGVEYCLIWIRYSTHEFDMNCLKDVYWMILRWFGRDWMSFGEQEQPGKPMRLI